MEPFALSDVVLERDTKGRDTPFIKNRDKFVRGLAASNPDNFLYNFRDAFGAAAAGRRHAARRLGQPDDEAARTRERALPVGDRAGLREHDLRRGAARDVPAEDELPDRHALRSVAEIRTPGGRQAAPPVGDPAAVPAAEGRAGYDSNLRKGAIRTDYWNWGAGFISAYPPDQFIMLEKGATYGTQDSQIWAPYYTLHKILAGLLDSYEVAGNKKALDIAKGMGAWAYTRLKALPPETRISMWNRYIAGEYGGMNEVMARLFRLTGDKQFLECAKLFDNTSLFFGNAAHDHGLAKNVDTIRGKHANQHIPQITGALETFRNTKELPTT